MKLPDENEKSKSNENSNNKESNWFKRKINYFIRIIKSLLTQGISPQKISLAIATGFTIGTFPILGTHTLLGIILAFVFKLNQVAVYIGSWMSAPIYVLLLLPSLRTGEFILKAETMDLDKFITNLKRMFHSFQDFTDVSAIYGQSILHIVIGWIPIAIVLTIAVYIIAFIFARILIKKKS